MTLLTISELKIAAREHSPEEAVIHAQIESITRKEASNGKPFQEAIFRDATESLTLRAWADSEAFESCSEAKPGEFVIDGTVDGGGHAAAIMRKIMPSGTFLGVESDDADQKGETEPEKE